MIGMYKTVMQGGGSAAGRRKSDIGTARWRMAGDDSSSTHKAGRIKDARGRPAILRVLSYPFRQAWGAFQYIDGAYLRGHPELELFSTARDRRRAVRRVVARFLWRRAFWSTVGKAVVLAILLALLALAVLAALRTWHPLPIRDLLPWAVAPLAIVIGIAVFFANRGMSRHVPELLRRELLDCGVPICVACGYPLFGLPGPNCPECGSPFDAEVRRILDSDAGPVDGQAGQPGVVDDSSNG